SNVQTNQSELKLLSNQISSKVEKSEYTTDINGITQDIKNTKSEINQLSDSVNSKITSVEQKFDELEVGGKNLLVDSINKGTPWDAPAERDILDPLGKNNAVKVPRTKIYGYRYTNEEK